MDSHNYCILLDGITPAEWVNNLVIPSHGIKIFDLWIVLLMKVFYQVVNLRFMIKSCKQLFNP